MMLPYRNLCVPVLVGLLAVAPLAASAAVDMGGAPVTQAIPESEIGRLMDVAGVNNSLGVVPSLMLNAIMRGKPGISDDERLAIAQKANDGRVVGALAEYVRNDIRTRLSAGEVKDIITWFTSDIGKRVILAERAVATADGQKKMQEVVQRGAANTLDFDRSLILRELDQRTRSSVTQKLIFDDFLDMLSANSNNIEAVDKARKEIHRAQRDLEDKTVYAMAFAFTGVSDADLKAYVAFYSTESGQKWVDILRRLTREMWRQINQSTFDNMDLMVPREAMESRPPEQ